MRRLAPTNWRGSSIEAGCLLTQLLRALAGCGRTVVATSHILESVSECDRVHWLHSGVITGSYTRADAARLWQRLLESRRAEKRAALAAIARRQA